MPNRPETYVTAIGIVAAVQFDGASTTAARIRRWVDKDEWVDSGIATRDIVAVHVKTPNGTVVLAPDDWLIKQDDALYVVSDDAFQTIRTVNPTVFPPNAAQEHIGGIPGDIAAFEVDTEGGVRCDRNRHGKWRVSKLDERYGRTVLVSGQYVSDDNERFGYVYDSANEAYAALKANIRTQ